MPTQKTIAVTGNVLVAEAMRQCAPDMMAAYPITPQTTIVEEFAKFVANGRVHTEYVTVESEHSAMSACVGASAAGARVMTATSSQGLALHVGGAAHRVGLCACRSSWRTRTARSPAPINIHCDHSDIMGARDAGWVILFAETAQEAYDNTIMAVRIAEHPDVLLPVMSTLDGSHHRAFGPRRRWRTRRSRVRRPVRAENACSTPSARSRTARSTASADVLRVQARRAPRDGARAPRS